VITASSGIRRATAIALGAEGVHVLIARSFNELPIWQATFWQVTGHHGPYDIARHRVSDSVSEDVAEAIIFMLTRPRTIVSRELVKLLAWG
jgi:NAD(P)-dependent dehydrogenase (short-subunit alcohol dehydrogenase family)